MDLVFNALPDVFSYQSLRHASYDAPWLNDANANKARSAPEKQRAPAAPTACSGRDRRDSCPLCQEKQRRPLATYIRSKSRQDRREDSSIQEEAEEEEEEVAAEAVAAAAPAPVAGAAAAAAAAAAAVSPTSAKA